MKEQVHLRQSTEDVESIMKQLQRADLMVTNRLATLRSWLDGEGVTVQGKGKKHYSSTSSSSSSSSSSAAAAASVATPVEGEH